MDDELGIAFERFQPAYEVVASQLRASIVSGSLAPGQRLPSEVSLAAKIGVSRATIREAFRTLSSEGLIVTKKGSGGGSVVAHPSLDQVTEHIRRSLGRLSQVRAVTLDHFMQLRQFLELPAMAMAASMCTEEDLDRLRSTITYAEGDEDAARATPIANRDFHTLLIDICRNPLLKIATEPIFLVLHTGLDRSLLPPDFNRCVAEQHVELIAALAERDEAAGVELMRAHLDWLHPRYQEVWKGL